MSLSTDCWEFFQGPDLRWRWRRTSSGGQVLAASLGSYAKRSACLANARRMGFEAGSLELPSGAPLTPSTENLDA